MKLAVIMDDHAAAANVGGNSERRVVVFDMPKEVEEFINKWRMNNHYMVFSLAESVDPETMK